MDLQIDRAAHKDIKALINLYFQVYGPDYPIRIGQDPVIMKYAIDHPEEYLWLVMREKQKKIVASTIFQLDRKTKIGRVIGVVVAHKYRGKHIAGQLIQYGTSKLLGPNEDINALYTTTRTISIASQLMFLNKGYLPLGIFPNAHKIKHYETLTFMGAFRDGVLEKRKFVPNIPDKLKPILKISNQVLGKKIKYPAPQKSNMNPHSYYLDDYSNDQFEFIFAPEFVKKRFNKTFHQTRDDYFFPFDTPNLLVTTTQTDLELYTYFGPKDHYCALIACTGRINEYGSRLERLIFEMKGQGIAYIEALVRLDWEETIEYFLKHRFLPSALYPALKEKDGCFNDFILLSRTMQPIDFNGMEIDSSFKPYVDQYIDQWINMHVSTLAVFDHNHKRENNNQISCR